MVSFSYVSIVSILYLSVKSLLSYSCSFEGCSNGELSFAKFWDLSCSFILVFTSRLFFQCKSCHGIHSSVGQLNCSCSCLQSLFCPRTDTENNFAGGEGGVLYPPLVLALLISFATASFFLFSSLKFSASRTWSKITLLSNQI